MFYRGSEQGVGLLLTLRHSDFIFIPKELPQVKGRHYYSVGYCMICHHYYISLFGHQNYIKGNLYQIKCCIK